MNKLLALFAILSFCFLNTTNAQKSEKSDISLGFRIGINGANVNIPNFNGVENLLSPPRGNGGLVAGAILGFRINEKTSIQAEALFIRKGFKVTDAAFDQIFGEDFEIDLGLAARTSINYIELNPSIKYLFTNKIFSPYFSAGPYIGYAMSGNIREDLNIGFFNIDINRSDLNLQQQIYNRIDIGVVGGLGLQASFNAGYAFTDLQFGYSFNSFLDNGPISVQMNHIGLRWGIGCAFYL